MGKEFKGPQTPTGVGWGWRKTSEELYSFIAQQVKNPPAMQETWETWVQSPSQEDPLKEENGNPLQYSCLENPMDRGVWWAIQSMGSQRLRHNWATEHKHTCSAFTNAGNQLSRVVIYWFILPPAMYEHSSCSVFSNTGYCQFFSFLLFLFVYWYLTGILNFIFLMTNETKQLLIRL